MARRIAAVLVTIGCLQAGAVSALGLGELSLDSFLNEPFKAKVDLLNTGGLSEHQIRIRLATSEDFDRLGVERAYFLTSITFEVEIDESGRGQIIMSSEAPVLEPYLDFIVEARWPSGRLLREYTVLVDPPVFNSDQAISISASESVEVAEGGSVTTSRDKKKTETSGTAVKVAKSELPQGEMPQRDFGSEASSSPQAGNRYMIRRDETLWVIALKGKPEGTGVHQAMLDIQRMNPRAFIDGNINRIKAGYIIYLPDSGDISSDDVTAAMDEVRQQNQDWRDGVASSPGNYSGASLRISTEAEEESTDAESLDSEAGSATGSVSDTANLENLERSERDRAEVEDRLAAMEQQVDTLENIVTLKDGKIAALEQALAEANAANFGDAAQVGTLDLGEQDGAVLEPVVEPEPVPAPVVVEPAPPAAKAEEESGLFGYIIGLLVAAALAAFFFIRRRNARADDEELSDSDVFADIQLEDENLDVSAEQAGEEPRTEPEQEAQVEPVRSRGYGQHKHDEYADDMDTGDALAEADIYIAYGRFPQAIDLLKTAIGNEPRNATYKLKLMEVSAEIGDQAEVMSQYAELKNSGDANTLARADDIVQGLDGSAEKHTPFSDSNEDSAPASFDLPDALDVPELDEAPILDIADSADEINLEDDFSSLEIEDFTADEDELDLSADFATDDTGTADSEAEEELVFAEDSDVMSTKLDLARAYLDMGDQDGAKAIFEEVISEGSEEQKEEARAMLERLG
jgi:pilus assembly protein FimV